LQMTIHKPQVLTLNKVVANCGESVFNPRMASTAGSSVRRLEDLMFYEYSSWLSNDVALQELERVENSMQ